MDLLEMLRTITVHILKWLLISFVLFFLPGQLLAAVPKVDSFTKTDSFCGSPTVITGSTISQFGNNIVGYYNSCSSRFITSACSSSGNSVFFTVVDNEGGGSCLTCGSCGSVSADVVSLCPANSTESGSVCNCNSGFTESGSSCVAAQPSCPSDKTIVNTFGLYRFGTSKPSSSVFTAGVPIVAHTCIDGKRASWGGAGGTVNTDGIVEYYRNVENGAANYFVRGRYAWECGVDNTHVPCSGSSSPSEKLENVPPDSCLSGQSVGTINGVKYCFTSDGQAQNPNASEQRPTVETTTNPSTGATTAITTYPDGSSSTVVKDASGNVTGGGSSAGAGTGPGSEFCKDNPGNSVCGSFAGGSCIAGFTCSGDAIQCAIMREQHIRNCLLFDDRSHPVTQLGDQMIDGTALHSADPRLEANRETVNLANTFNVTPRIGVECVEDDVFSIYGQEVRLPWHVLCPYLDIAGQVLVILTMVMSMGIMFGRTS